MPPHLKKILLAGSPPEDYFPLGWISYGTNPPHLKDFFFGGLQNFETKAFFASAGKDRCETSAKAAPLSLALEAEGLQKPRISYVIAYWRREIFILS